MSRHYEIINPRDGACEICRGIAKVYNESAAETAYFLPEEYGTGYVRKSAVGRFAAVLEYDFILQKGITMEETSREDCYKLCFCLENSFEWWLGDSRKVFIMEQDESRIFPSGFLRCIGRYEPGLRYRGIGISLHPQRYQSVIQHLGSAGCGAIAKPGLPGPAHLITPAVRELVRQLIDAPYEGFLKKLYQEGKILELTAEYLYELLFAKEQAAASVKLSRQDKESLRRARDILTERLAEPATIAELARLVYMNEYKLKMGFKTVYGQSIHSYLVAKRMEKARQLFDKQKLKVKDVAGIVGYTNISHFSAAFRKQFGVNPGIYLQNIH